jgi:hypothetical protein
MQGAKGLHVAATALAMLGIVHGISAGASSLSSVNVEATASMITFLSLKQRLCETSGDLQT